MDRRRRSPDGSTGENLSSKIFKKEFCENRISHFQEPKSACYNMYIYFLLTKSAEFCNIFFSNLRELSPKLQNVVTLTTSFFSFTFQRFSLCE